MNSFWPTPQTRSFASSTVARLLVVPWSTDKTKRLVAIAFSSERERTLFREAERGKDEGGPVLRARRNRATKRAMKNLALAALLGSFVVGLALSCGPARCSPSNCLGCCDASGACQAGSAPTACGTGAGSCQQCFGAAACVNGQCGSLGGGSGGGSGGGGGGGGGGNASDAGVDAGTNPDAGANPGFWFRAYNLVIGGATPAASCFRSGVLPPNAAIPAGTVEALVWQSGGSQFITFDRTLTWKLGDAPSIRPPTATKGGSGTLAWQAIETRPIGALYTEARSTAAAFTFDSLATASTTGALQLRAEYACINGSQACPTGTLAPADAASCQLTLSFTAQLVPLTAKWTTPAAPVTGAQTYLAAMDATPVRTIANPACFRNNMLPTGRGSLVEQNARELDLWQVFAVGPTSYLRTSQQTFMLGDAPAIRVSSDLASDGGVYLQTTSQQGTSTGYTELPADAPVLPPHRG